MTPAMCGEAIDVPLRLRPRKPVTRSADQIVWPGAVMSGFSPTSPIRGPRDENDESASIAGCCRSTRRSRGGRA